MQLRKALGMSTVGIVVLVVLLLLFFGAWPAVGFVNYGYGPSGLVGLLVIVLIVLIVTGRI